MIYRILICIILVLGIYQLVTHFYRDEEKELRTQVRTAVKEAFPEHQEELDGMLDSYSEKVSGFRSEDLDTIKSLLAAMTDGLGDGLVSVESTRLPGIAHMTVKGTHLSMIRNLTPDSERIPPALPIIIRYLNETVTPEG